MLFWTAVAMGRVARNAKKHLTRMLIICDFIQNDASNSCIDSPLPKFYRAKPFCIMCLYTEYTSVICICANFIFWHLSYSRSLYIIQNSRIELKVKVLFIIYCLFTPLGGDNHAPVTELKACIFTKCLMHELLIFGASKRTPWKDFIRVF